MAGTAGADGETGTNAAYEAFLLQHQGVLQGCGLPPSLFRRLHEKLSAEVFDAGGSFGIELLPGGRRRVVATRDIAPLEDVYLVDHAWSFRADELHAGLRANPALVERLTALMGLDAAGHDDVDNGDDGDDGDDEYLEEGLRRLPPPAAPPGATDPPALERVAAATWRHAGCYRLGTGTVREDSGGGAAVADSSHVWFLPDEFGASVRHSANPGLRDAPFVHLPPGGGLDSAAAYSLLWPITALEEGDEAARDYAEGATGVDRLAKLAAFFAVPAEPFAHALAARSAAAAAAAMARAAVAPPPLPPPVVSPPIRRPLRVLSDVTQLRLHLTRPEFAFTDSPSAADILWMSSHMDAGAMGVEPTALLNQFPYESALVMKHHLAATIAMGCGSPGGKPPPWAPEPTFDLTTELPAAVGEFLRRQAAGEDNTWALKPWNLARSLDSRVVADLSALVRAADTGPKVAQKYIHSPALFRGRKFDLRFMVAVRSFSPPALSPGMDSSLGSPRVDAWVHDRFIPRLANAPFSLSCSGLEDYETHYTVMNYRPGAPLTRVPDADFAAELCAGRGGAGAWAAAIARVNAMLHDLLAGAVALHPGLADGRCRSLYGVDVMLDDDLRPKLLEVTFAPDCTRVCAQAADFYNVAFGALFLGESHPSFVRLRPGGEIAADAAAPAAGTSLQAAAGAYDGLD